MISNDDKLPTTAEEIAKLLKGYTSLAAQLEYARMELSICRTLLDDALGKTKSP